MRRLNFRRDDGVAMTEFALILPIFMVIVAGLLAFGRVFFYWIEANHLANETARWAVVDRNPYAPTTLQQHARDASSTVEFENGVKVCIDFPAGRHPAVGDRSVSGPEAVLLRPDPQDRHDHDPGLVDDAHRAVRRRRYCSDDLCRRLSVGACS